MVGCLKEAGEKVEKVDCGFRHCVARTSLGKIYTWGWGLSGQLGHDSNMSELSPRHLNLDKKNRKNKAIQIAAGYEHSVILLESRHVLWFGKNGTLVEPQLKPVKCDLSEKIPEIFPPHDYTSGIVNQNHDFWVTKINCTWNKSMSTTDIVIADVRSLENISAHSIQACIKTLSHNWDSKDIEPPYIESISKYFSVNTMKKSNTQNSSKNSLKSKSSYNTRKHASPAHKRKMY
jgi:myosin-5